MFQKETIQFVDQIDDWKTAIRQAAMPLVELGNIETSYIDAMIESVEELGFYIVLDEGLAMPHARPEAGVNEGGVSFMKVDQAVDFGGQDVHLIFVLAAQDSDAHIKRLQELMGLFQDQELMNGLREAKDLETVQDLLLRR